jgi:iron complex outermembrane receptor protein
MKKSLSVLLVLILFFSNSEAQNKICGVIKCEDELVEYATITCPETKQGVLSNSKGEFCLNVDNYPIHLEISCLGYNKSVLAIADGNTNLSNIQLKKGTFEANEVIISATRTDHKQGATFQLITKKEIEKLNIGQDLPYILQYTPSAINTSDAGAGVGYTSLRIRGTDATRINTTVNGVPVNDAESQGTYWVDFPDLASSAQSIQIQRGVGTSSNGSGAFGASINIQTLSLRDSAYASMTNNFGSFKTMRNTLAFGTGLLHNHFTLNGRLSKISSDGFINRANSDMRSLYLDASYFGKKFSLHSVNFSGIEKTYQAWNGVPQAKYDGDSTNLINHYYNNLGYLYLNKEDSTNLFGSANNKYNYFTYKDQTDNYWQNNNQLHSSFNISKHLLFNLSLHYTRGYGYYEEYKFQDNLSYYGLPAVILSNDTINSSNLIRQKWLDNYFYGTTYSFIYKKHNFTSILGGSSNQYFGKHYTKIIWSEYASNSTPNFEYDLNTSLKNDNSIYTKNILQVNDKLGLYADLQYRKVNYYFKGFDIYLQPALQSVKYNFINPKVGITYDINKYQNLYASYSVANREPMRDDFTSSTPNSRPLSERLYDLEIGYKINRQKFNLQFINYYMRYHNQLVLTGMINDVGSYTRSNVSKSYRLGLEILAEYHLNKKVKFFANATLSRNKIDQYDEYIYGYFSSNPDSISTTINHYKNTDIAFSPNLMGLVGVLVKPIKNLEISYIAKYVWKQFLDNTSQENKSLHEYLLNDLRMTYQLRPKWCKQFGINASVNNLFNYRYASNGYTYSSMYDSQVIRENFVYPQAGINVMLGFMIGF